MKQYLENKILKTLVGYLRENSEAINPKKYIYLNDYLEFIPSKEHNNELIKIFNEYPDFYYYLHESDISVYVNVKKEVSENNRCALMIMRGENILLKSFDPYLTRIDPNKIVRYYCKTNSIRADFNDLRYLIWDSLEYIKENIGVYGQIRELNNKHFVEIAFQNPIKENEDNIEFLKLLLFNEGVILDIFNNPILKNLKDRFENYIKVFLPKSILKIFYKCIDINSFREFFSLLLIISYLRQFDKEMVNFEKAFSFLNNKTKIVQNFDLKKDILPLNEDLKEISELSNLFLENLIADKSKESIQLFNFPRIIREIEETIKFNDNYAINKVILNLPDLSVINKDIANLIFDIWLSFGFISHFIGNVLKILTKLIQDEGFTSEIILKTSFIFKTIDQFKKNLFFRIGNEGAEYWIKLKFLKNFCKNIFYLYHLINDVITDLDEIQNDHEKWKLVFEKFYLPLNRCLEKNIDTTSQFIQSEAFDINIYANFIEDKTIEAIEKINDYFIKYIRENYKDWVIHPNSSSTPLSVINAFKRMFFPNFTNNPKNLKKYYLILLIDCCHLGLWNLLKQKILNDFPELEIKTHIGYSILPTKTKYSREALFSGNYPKDFNHESEFHGFIDLIKANGFRRYGTIDLDMISDHFITNCENIFDFKRAINKAKAPDINLQICIFNFSDQASHTFSQTFLRRLIESIYNSKIRPLIDLVLKMKDKEFQIFFATDHGSSRCTERFIWGENKFDYFFKKKYGYIFDSNSPRTFITFEEPSNFDKTVKKLIAIKSNEAEKWGLKPTKKIQQRKEDDFGFKTVFKSLNYFFAINFQNLTFTRYNKRDPKNFGHGGISMDEFIIPFANIKKKSEDFEDFNRQIEVDLKVDDIETDPKYQEISIILKNNSNRDIKFKKGHIINKYIHYKFIKYKDFLIVQKTESTILKIKLPKDLIQGLNKFHFSYYQDEKLEKSKKFKYNIE